VDKNNLTKDTIQDFKRKSVWSFRLFKGMIPRRVNIARYQLENQYILDSKESEAKLELIEITRELVDRIGKSK
jgi:cellulose biosynthesis protein BcsQ